MAASAKIICSIAVAVRAIPNINSEIKGWKGVVNIAMLPMRIKNAIGAFGIYRDNLGLQITAYQTMYNQIKGLGYEIREDTPQGSEQTREALERIRQAEPLLASLTTKINILASGQDVTFSDADFGQIATLAAIYPDQAGSAARAFLASVR